MPSSSWQFAHAARAGLVDIDRLLVFPIVVGGGKQLFADGASASGFRPLPTPPAVLGSCWIIKAADLDGALRWALEASKAGAGSRYVRSRTSLRSRPDTGAVPIPTPHHGGHHRSGPGGPSTPG
jgi:hypothetical protein